MTRILAFAVFFLTLVSLGGDERGTGGDVGSGLEYSAYFTGDVDVNFCLEVAPDFGVGEQEIRNSVDFTINAWQNYVLERLPRKGAPGPFFSLHFVEKQKCDGRSEHLRFLFGVKDRFVDQELIYYRDPAAVAARPSQERPGFIWIGPSRVFYFGGNRIKIDWRYGNALRGILLHEFGHLFGMKHIPGTIMSESILAQLGVSSSDECISSLKDYVLKIDQLRELVPCVRCELEHSFRRWEGSLGVSPQEIRANFQSLVGRPAKGEVQASYMTQWRAEEKKTYFVISDDLTKNMEFPIDLDANRPIFPNYGLPVFKRYFFDGALGGHFSSHEYHSIGVVSGAIVTGTRKRFALRFSYNEGIHAPIVFSIPDMEFTPLQTFFASDAPPASCVPTEYSHASPLGLPNPGNVPF